MRACLKAPYPSKGCLSRTRSSHSSETPRQRMRTPPERASTSKSRQPSRLDHPDYCRRKTRLAGREGEPAVPAHRRRKSPWLRVRNAAIASRRSRRPRSLLRRQALRHRSRNPRRFRSAPRKRSDIETPARVGAPGSGRAPTKVLPLSSPVALEQWPKRPQNGSNSGGEKPAPCSTRLLVIVMTTVVLAEYCALSAWFRDRQVDFRPLMHT